MEWFIFWAVCFGDIGSSSIRWGESGKIASFISKSVSKSRFFTNETFINSEYIWNSPQQKNIRFPNRKCRFSCGCSPSMQYVLHWLGSGKRFPREDSNLTLHTPRFWMERDSPALVESKEVVVNLVWKKNF